MHDDIHQRKMRYLFLSYDSDGNGYIEESDFEAIATRAAEAQGHARGSAAHQSFRSYFHKFFETIRDAMDADKDGRISPEEFVQFFMQTQKEPNSSAEQIANFIGNEFFTSADRDNDGRVSADEFAAICKSCLFNEDDSNTAFGLYSRSQPGEINRAEWDAMIKDMFFNNDPTCGGSILLGAQRNKA